MGGHCSENFVRCIILPVMEISRGGVSEKRYASFCF